MKRRLWNWRVHSTMGFIESYDDTWDEKKKVKTSKIGRGS